MESLEGKIGYSFKNKNLLKLAVTHKSSTHDDVNCYERLEFLGDAVLEFIVSKYLYENYNLSEGRLTHIRAAVVCKQTLSRIAEKLNLKEFIRMGENEKKTKLEENKSIQADIVEAIFGAIFLDSDINTANDIILSLLEPYIKKAHEGKLFYDYKTKLQEFIQREKRGTIRYIDKSCVNYHKKEFKVELYLDDKKISEGYGNSKKEAEQKAALKALKLLGENTDEI